MLIRKIALVSGLAVGLVLALLPWTVASGRVTAAIARQIRQDFGLSLSVRGRSTVSLLPVPRLTLEEVSLSEPDGLVEVEAGQMKAELRLWPMLLGRLRVAELRIAGAQVRVALERSRPDRWPAALAAIRARLGSDRSSRIERLVVTGASVAATDPAGRASVDIRKLGLLVRWPDPAGDLDLAASGEWNGEMVAVSLSGLSPRLLLSGESDRIEASVTTRLGQFGVDGALGFEDGPHFEGIATGRAPALGALARWTGVGLDLGEVEGAVAITGGARIDLDTVEWPRAVLELGGDRLDGALAYRFAGARPQLRATLAGEELDLGWVLPLVDPARMQQPRTDYDIRLSASGLKLGRLRVTEAATGILVSGGRAELSLGRASMAGGSVRGRVSAGLDGEGRDIRGQVALEGVNLERLLAELGAVPALAGMASGQATFEVTGDRRPGLVRHLRGRVALTARDGEISGLALPEGRPDPRAQAAIAPDWRRGKARFGLAQISLDLADGLAEIRDGTVETTGGQTIVKGRVSLADGTLTLRTLTWGTASGPATARPPLVLDLVGPLNRLSVTPGLEVEATGTAVRSSR